MVGTSDEKAALEEEGTEGEGRNWFQILAILIACLASFSNGMTFSWTSPAVPKIVEDKVNYDISMEEASYFTVISPFGLLFSCVLFSKLLDIIGRKWTLYCIVIPHIAVWILTATARSVWVFYVTRFISGISDGCLFISIPVYIGEIASPGVRGSWGNCMTLFIYVGEFSITAIGSYTSIQTSSYIGLSVILVFLCLFPLMPESPYYLLMKDRPEDARNSLRRLRRKDNVDAELKQMQADVKRQMSESGTWKDLLTVDSNQRAVVAGIFLRGSQQLGGIDTFILYTQYIFLKSGGSLSASTSSMIFLGLCALLNLCASFTLDKLGRRVSYVFSCLFCGIMLVIEAVYFFIEEQYPSIDVSVANWIPVAGMIGYVVFYSFGLGIVPTLMLGELFSTSVKGKGLCLMNIVFAVLLSGVTKMFYLLESNFGLFAPFLLFATSCMVSTVLSFYFVPETKGKTLEEIQQSLKGKGSGQETRKGKEIECRRP